MTTPADRLARNYPPRFLAFLTRRDEQNLSRAYELGRDALADGISLLDLIRTHHAVLGNVLAAAPDAADTVDAAAAFLLEALAPYEMARRGFMENAAAPQHPGDAGHSEPGLQ